MPTGYNARPVPRRRRSSPRPDRRGKTQRNEREDPMTRCRTFRWATVVALLALATTALQADRGGGSQSGNTDPPERAAPPSPTEQATDPPDPSQIANLLVLFLPLTEITPPPPKDGSNGGKNDGNKSPGSAEGGQNPPGSSGGGQDPQGSKDPGSVPFIHHPEPATLVSGLIGAGVLALAGWRRRRSST
jgi:hypothetical protein